MADHDDDLDRIVYEALKYTQAIQLCPTCKTVFIRTLDIDAEIDAYGLVLDRTNPDGSPQFKTDNVNEAMGHCLSQIDEECAVCAQG